MHIHGGENFEKDFISAPLTQWGWNQPQRARISNVVHSRGQCSIISNKVCKQHVHYHMEYIILNILLYKDKNIVHMTFLYKI